MRLKVKNVSKSQFIPGRIVKIDYREKQSRKNKSRLTSIPINTNSRKSIIIFNIWSIKFAKFIIIYSP